MWTPLPAEHSNYTSAAEATTAVFSMGACDARVRAAVTSAASACGGGDDDDDDAPPPSQN